MKVVVSLFVLFLASRLLFLQQIPVFNDEAIVLHQGITFLANPSSWLSLQGDGKQPLFAVSMGVAQLLPFSPIVSGRLVSVAWAVVTFLATVAIGRRIGIGKKPLMILMLLLTVSPFLGFYDRLALSESPVTACFALMLFLTLSLVEKPVWWKGILLGIVAAVGWWYFSLILLAVPAIGVTFLITARRWRSQWRVLALSVLLAAVVFLLLIAPVATSDVFRYHLRVDEPKRTLGLAALLAIPVRLWAGNALLVASWFLGLATPLVMACSTAAVVRRVREERILILTVWAALPLALSVLLVSVMSARNLVIVMPMVLLLAAVGVDRFGRWSAFVTSVTVTTSLLATTFLFFLPTEYFKLLSVVPAAQRDFAQYVVGWPSGYGVKEAADFIRQQAEKQPLIVLVEYRIGNPEDALYVFLRNEAKVTILPFHELDGLIARRKRGEVLPPVLYVGRSSDVAGIPKVFEIARFRKPLDAEVVGVYRVPL